MKVLITGANGQLGREVASTLLHDDVVFAYSRFELDVTNEEQVNFVFNEVKPDVIVHCAAYTAVDLAESNQEDAFMVNAQGTKYVAQAARQVGAKVCYISTDYVFDGKGTSPYNEHDTPNPQTVYGKSKLLGEQFIQQHLSEYYIVRTSWLFGKYGNNFVKTVLKVGKNQGKLQVVNDQFGSPTYTTDLAAFLNELIRTDWFGTYHVSNSGSCTWYEFAKEIFANSKISVELTPCKTAEFPRPAPRPAYSVLAHTALQANGFRELPEWQDALKRFLAEIGEMSV